MFPWPDGGTHKNLRRLVGLVDKCDSFKGRQRCMVKVYKTANKTDSRVLEERWFPLAQPLNFKPDLETRKNGTLMVEEIVSLEELIGQEGVCNLLSKKTRTCCILDVKKRVQDEVQEALPLREIGYQNSTGSIVLRDLIRLESEGPRAISETSCAKVCSEAGEGWELTVFAGGLNFLREWDNCDSPVRIVVLSPTENSYNEGIRFSNELYQQRSRIDLEIPVDLLLKKPLAIDLQLMYG